MKARLWVTLAVAVAAVAAFAVPAGAQGGKAYTIDGACQTVTDEGAQAYLDAQIEDQGGTAVLYVYEGPDAQDVNGFTAFPDTDGDYGTGAKESLEAAITGPDDLVDSVFYPPGENEIQVDAYTVVAGCHPGAGVPDIDHSPLCYTHFSDDVVFFANGDLLGLLARGYWVPQASKAGGGQAIQTGSAYHYLCNAPASAKPTGTKVGEDGVTVVSDAFAGTNLWWWEVVA